MLRSDFAGCAPAGSAGDGVFFEHGNLQTALLEQISCGEPGDSSADYRYVSVQLAMKNRIKPPGRKLAPKRFFMFRKTVHPKSVLFMIRQPQRNIQHLQNVDGAELPERLFGRPEFGCCKNADRVELPEQQQ